MLSSRHAKTLYSAIALTLFLIVLSTLLVGCTLSPEAALEKARKVGTPEAYQAFEKKYPASPLVAEAKKLEDDAAYVLAKSENKIEAFKAYLEKYPNGVHSNDAKRQSHLLYIKNLDQFTGTLIVSFPDSMGANLVFEYNSGTININRSHPPTLFLRTQNNIKYLLKIAPNAELENIPVAGDLVHLSLGVTHIARGKIISEAKIPTVLVEHISATTKGEQKVKMGVATGGSVRIIH
jgi:hypothetical protein